jgi:hypothetical protein
MTSRTITDQHDFNCFFNKLVHTIAHDEVFSFTTGYTSDLLSDALEVQAMAENGGTAWLFVREGGTTLEWQPERARDIAKQAYLLSIKSCFFIDAGSSHGMQGVTIKAVTVDSVAVMAT